MLTPTPGGAATADTITFAELLTRLGYGTDDENARAERVSINHQALGTRFRSDVYKWPTALEKGARVAKWSGWNGWFGANALGPVSNGRGKEADVTRIAAIVADLDFKERGCRDLSTALVIANEASEVFGEHPVAVTHSGHGLQIFWGLEVKSARALTAAGGAKQLLTRALALVADIAGKHGCQIDSTFDLVRVWRMPESVNHKDPENPVPVRCYAAAGKPLTVEQITKALDEYGIPDAPAAKTSSKKPRGEKKPKADKPPLYAVSAAMTPGKPSPKVRERLGSAMTDVAIDTDRHHHTRDHTLALLRYGYNGEPGVGEALEALYRHFTVTVGPDRMCGDEQAAQEFADFVSGAEDLLAAEAPQEKFEWPGPKPKFGAAADDQPPGAGAQEPRGKKPTREISWRTAAEIRDRRPEWAWTYNGGGRLPRSALSLFAARPGVGKSTAARWFAAGITLGTVEGCFHGQPQNVAYIATEESLEAMVKPSLRAVNADMSRIFFPKVEMDGKAVRLLSVLDEEALTADLIKRGITVVIVDPVMSTVGGKVDLNRNNEIRDCLEPWARMAEAINGMVLAIVHLIKVPGGDILAAINGSSAFGEVSRAVIAFALDLQAADGTGVLSQEKNNAGRNDLSLAYSIESATVQTDDLLDAKVARFVIGGESDRRVGDVLHTNNAGERLGARSWEVVEVVRGANAPTGAEVVSAAVAGLSRNDATKYLRRLERAGFLVRRGRGLYEYRRALGDRLRETP